MVVYSILFGVLAMTVWSAAFDIAILGVDADGYRFEVHFGLNSFISPEMEVKRIGFGNVNKGFKC